MAKRICVTGGAGYIGSHTVLEMLQAGFEVVVFDSLYNATREAFETGVSPIRPMYFEYPEEDMAYAADMSGNFAQYLLLRETCTSC